MDLYGLHALLSALVLPTLACLIWRGSKATERDLPSSSRVFRYSRWQRRVTLGAGIPLVVFIVVLPWRWAPLTSLSDLAIMLALLAGCSILLLEVIKRRVLISPEGISSTAWRDGKPLLPWARIERVTFHDVFGGFFLVHHAAGRLYIPVQVERPLELIRALEDHVPVDALAPARRGMAICRAHLADFK